MKNLTRVHIHPKHSLTAVVPIPSDAKRSRKICGRVCQFLVATFRAIHNFFDRLPGQCTVSKLDAFTRFKQETSPRKVAAILLLTPLPCLAINLLIECIPLNDPSTGFKGSGWFQLRWFLVGFFVSLMPSLKKLDCVPGSPVSPPLALTLFALSQACIGLLTNAIISLAAHVFPAPLSQFTPIIPMAIAGRLLFYRHMPADPQLHAQSNKLNLWLSVEALPVLMYPAFTVAFMALSPAQQFWVSFLLPLLRIATRRMLWFVTKDDHDLIGVMVCCVGHLYHVLFIATILQNSKSLKTMGVVAFFSGSKMLLNCYYILNDLREFQAAKRKLDDFQESDDYLNLVLRIADEPLVAKALHNHFPSLLLSTYPKYHGADFLARHEELLKSVTPVQEKWAKLAQILKGLPKRARHATIHVVRVASRPSFLLSQRPKSSPAWHTASLDVHPTAKREAVVTKFAYALHQSQIMLLKSYVTLCMSSFYAIYLVVVFWLPNRQYFATQANMTSFEAVGSTVTRLLFICGMEIVIFSIYLALIRRQFGVSGLYQLAFMLWSQRVLVQGQFIQLTVSILGFPLTHSGNDILLPLQSPSTPPQDDGVSVLFRTRRLQIALHSCRLATMCTLFSLFHAGNFITSEDNAVMPAVAPSPVNVSLQQDIPSRILAVLAVAWTKISLFAGRLPGQDSVSKLDLFETFVHETTPWRVAMILVLTPLPWLIVNLLLEFIPLDDPATGFWRSGCYQLRMFLTAVFSAVAPVLVKINCVPGFPLSSPWIIAAYALFQAGVCVGTNTIISLAADIFPVPFSQFTVIIPMVVSGRLVFHRHLPTDPQFHAQSGKVDQWLGMETLPILVYPVFTAVFMVLTPDQQLWVSLLLPVLKYAVRGALWSVAKNDEDLVGVITCCAGHLYHVLFTAMILQNAKSLETLGVVVLFSSGQMLFNCRYICNDADRINEVRAKEEGREPHKERDANLCTVLTFAKEMRIAQNLHWRTPSLLLSTYPGYRAATFLEQNQEMLRASTLYNAAFVYNNPKKAAARGPHSNAGAPNIIAVRKPSASGLPMGISRIMPWADGTKVVRQYSDQTIRLKSRSSFVRSPRSLSDPSAWANAERDEGRLARQEAVIHQVTSAFHQTELILLRSYVTICITLFYVIYLHVVFRLSNRQYFATLVYLTTIEAVNRTVQRLLLLCAMEMVFLSVYLVLISRRLGISGIYQLAFVLWSQRVLVQARFYVTIVILAFPLTHNGNDSILKF